MSVGEVELTGAIVAGGVLSVVSSYAAGAAVVLSTGAALAWTARRLRLIRRLRRAGRTGGAW